MALTRMLRVKDVTVECVLGRWVIEWHSADGDWRYHVWLGTSGDPELEEARQDGRTVFKNLPRETPHASRFSTRRYPLGGKFLPMFDDAVLAADVGKLWGKAREAEAKRVADQTSAHERAVAEARVREAAPDLLAALVRLLNCQPPPAIIFVDGEEFMRLWTEDNHYALFDQTVEFVGGEVALMVWKPRYGIYLRERLSITAEVA